MKFPVTFLIVAIFVLSCNNAKNKTVEKVEVPAETEQTAFFPVTDYIKGQITEIRNKGINPKKIIRTNNRQDSSWLKTEQLDNEFEMFLSPVIDSSNLSSLFIENKFLDQTIDAFTFTYDPVKPLPDSFLLQRWDVYVDAKKNTVRRIYLLKKTVDHKTLQLTWQSGLWCKLVTIADDTKGNAFVEKEVMIKWDF